MESRGNECQRSEKLCSETRVTFHHQLLASVSYELQHLFLTFGVVGNDFFREDI